MIDSKILNRFLGVPLYLPRELRSNIIHYYFDIGWWGLYMGATVAFLGVYATRIGASPGQIGLIGALSAVVSLLLSLPFAGLVRRLGAYRATWIAAILGRFPLALFALFPLGLSHTGQVRAIIMLSAMLAIPNTLLSISFNNLMLEAIPPNWRATVVGMRNAILSIIAFCFTVISGQILTYVAFPVGYQIVFVIGFVGAIATAYHLYKIRPLSDLIPPQPVAGLPPAGPGAHFRVTMPRMDAAGRRYLRALSILFFLNLTGNMIGPLMPGMLVNTLKLSDAWISLGSSVGGLIAFGVSLRIIRLLHRIGNRSGMALGAGLLAVQMVILAVGLSPLAYLVSVVLGGVASWMYSTAQMTYQLEIVPDDDRPTWFSWSVMLGNVAVLLGSLSGPEVAKLTGTPSALMLFGGLRLIMGLVILRWG